MPAEPSETYITGADSDSLLDAVAKKNLQDAALDIVYFIQRKAEL